MPSFTVPIVYSNQDFDEYQAACRHLGDEHVEWFRHQSDNVRASYTGGAWFANNLASQNAYHAVERWHGLKIT